MLNKNVSWNIIRYLILVQIGDIISIGVYYTDALVHGYEPWSTGVRGKAKVSKLSGKLPRCSRRWPVGKFWQSLWYYSMICYSTLRTVLFVIISSSDLKQNDLLSPLDLWTLTPKFFNSYKHTEIDVYGQTVLLCIVGSRYSQNENRLAIKLNI